MQALQFFVIHDYLLQPTADEKNAHKIKAKSDKSDHRRKLLYLFDFWHNLGYPVEHTDAGKSQGNTIDDLKRWFAFTRGIVLAIARFF